MSSSEYDYVIVGAGTAGCVLAGRLSEDPSVRVCLVEAGPRDTNPFIQVPAMVGAAIGTKSINWGFMTEPQAHLNNRPIPLPRGRVVGGSGSINGMAYFRGQPLDFDDWANAGCKGWSWREVLPYFIRSETNQTHVDSPYHGHDGPINVRHISQPNRLNQDFLAAFAALGEYPSCDDLNGPRPEGYGLRQGTIRNGRRDSSANAFLRPALSRRNLTLRTDSPVTRIVVEGNSAVGVEVRTSTGIQQLRATREVLLAAGAVQSPQILMLSGIGTADELQQHGITVQQHLPGVGGNYHDHLAASILMECRNTLSYGLSLRTAHRALWNGVQYLLWRDGPLASNLFESTAFIRTGPEADRPDLQIVFQPAKRNRTTTFPLPLGHGFAISSVGLYPMSRGRVHLVSRDPAAAPRVAANFLSDPADLKPLLHGLKLARRIFASEPFRRYAAVEVAPGPGVTSDADLIAYIRSIAATAHHPVGTCKMGTDEQAVVDPELRVHGVTNLRVVDASICPHVVGGNTNAGVVMIAEKAADMILGRTPPPPFELPAAGVRP